MTSMIEKNRGMAAISELIAHPQWVCWRHKEIVNKDGSTKLTKPPVNPIHGGGASHSKPEDWGTYEQARVFAMMRKLAGVGFVLSERDDFTGIDLDKCRNKETGEIEPWAREILDLAETYAEISPSGTGIRLIARGKVDHATKCDPAHVEIYGKQRYLTITGEHLPGAPTSIEPAPQTIAELIARAAEFQAAAEAAARAGQPEPAAAPVKERAIPRFTKRDGASGAPPPAAKPKRDSKDFFRGVNDAAMESLSSWVLKLFPQALYQPGTNGYRVSSADLGRNLEEDISIVPGRTGGITDFGIHDMGDARRGKRTPISLVQEWGGKSDVKDAALWLCDAMGVEPESLGWNERPPTTPAPQTIHVEDDGTIIDAETGEVIARPRAAPKAAAAPEDDGPVGEDLPEEFSTLPGLLGDIVEWFMDTAARPSRTMALATAIAIVGTSAGRFWGTPTRSGTHFYLSVIARTGAGKNHVINVITRIMRALEMSYLVGPSDFMSQSAVLTHVSRNPLSICPMDEFGAFLSRVQGKNKRASGFEIGISKSLRTLWGTNFDDFITAGYAQKNAETINSPALSLIGVSTAEEFWGALEGADISNGFLNRFIIFSVNKKTRQVEPKIPESEADLVPPSIVKRLKRIIGGGHSGIQPITLPTHKVNPALVQIADEAKKLYYDYAARATDRFEDTDQAHLAHFYARAAENALRLATVYALSMNQSAPRITVEAMQWGRDLVEWAAACTARSAGLYIAESESQENANRIKRILREAPGFTLKRSDIMARLNNRMRKRDFDDAMTMMIEAEQVVELEEAKKPGKAGRRPIRYRLNEKTQKAAA